MFLTFVTFLPLIGAALLAFVPDEKTETIKQAALGIAVADFLLRQPELLDQFPIPLRLLDRVQILTLDILNERPLS